MILMARHGQTAYNAEGRFQGTLEVGLDEVGRAQATALSEISLGHGIRSLWCSPLQRAQETAAAVAGSLGLEVRVEPRFAEHDTGAWTDRLKAEIEAEEPELWARYLRGGEDWTFPGGENLDDFMERVVDGFVEVTHGGELPALVVCHRGVIRAAQSHSHIRGLETFHEWPVDNGALIPL